MLTVPADLVPGLVDALEHLESPPPSERQSDGTLTLTASREVLRELLAVAIDEAGEAVARASTRLLRGEGSVGDLRARLAVLAGLVELLETAG